MRKYSLFALVHGLALLAAGLGVASTAQVSKYDCCYPGSPCCFVGSPCCEGNAADCCYPRLALAASSVRPAARALARRLTVPRRRRVAAVRRLMHRALGLAAARRGVALANHLRLI
jgi:hypothetical protein